MQLCKKWKQVDLWGKKEGNYLKKQQMNQKKKKPLKTTHWAFGAKF